MHRSDECQVCRLRIWLRSESFCIVQIEKARFRRPQHATQQATAPGQSRGLIAAFSPCAARLVRSFSIHRTAWRPAAARGRLLSHLTRPLNVEATMRRRVPGGRTAGGGRVKLQSSRSAPQRLRERCVLPSRVTSPGRTPFSCHVAVPGPAFRCLKIPPEVLNRGAPRSRARTGVPRP